MPAMAELSPVGEPTGRPGADAGDWLLGWARSDGSAARDRRSETIRIFLPGGMVLVAAAAASLILITMPLHHEPDEAGAAPAVEQMR